MVTSLYHAKPCAGSGAKAAADEEQGPSPWSPRDWFRPSLGALPWTALLTACLCEQEMLMAVLVCLKESLPPRSNEVGSRGALNTNCKAP